MGKEKPIEVGNDRVIVVKGEAETTFYRIKQIQKSFYFTFDELERILRALPFSFSIQPLNYDSVRRRFDEASPFRHLVEVFPRFKRVIGIYPPNFSAIQSAHVDNCSKLNLRPSVVMDDIEGGFRCSYFPRLEDMGFESKFIPSGLSGSLDGETIDDVEVDIHKFSEHDGRRINEYIQTLSDDSEEARMYVQLLNKIR